MNNTNVSAFKSNKMVELEELMANTCVDAPSAYHRLIYVLLALLKRLTDKDENSLENVAVDYTLMMCSVYGGSSKLEREVMNFRSNTKGTEITVQVGKWFEIKIFTDFDFDSVNEKPLTGFSIHPDGPKIKSAHQYGTDALSEIMKIDDIVIAFCHKNAYLPITAVDIRKPNYCYLIHNNEVVFIDKEPGAEFYHIETTSTHVNYLIYIELNKLLFPDLPLETIKVLAYNKHLHCVSEFTVHKTENDKVHYGNVYTTYVTEKIANYLASNIVIEDSANLFTIRESKI